MTTEVIDIRVREDGARVVRRNIEDIGKGADTAYASIERFNSILSRFAGFLGVREVMKWADAWSSATSSIKIATQTIADAIIVQDQLFKSAQRSRQEFGAMAELYAAVARQSEPLKKSQQELLAYTENIAKALAIQHTSMTAARGPLLQLGQAMGSGTIRAQEFNSIMLGLPYVMKVVAENFKGTGVSVMQLRQIMLQGKLESKDFFEAFQRGTEQINKDFEKTQITFGQAFTIFKNELIKFTGTMDSSTGVSTKFAAGLKFVADNLALLAGTAASIGLAKFITPYIESLMAMQRESAAAASAQRLAAAASAEKAAADSAAAAAAIRVAESNVVKTQSELSGVAATQAAIAVSREYAVAALAKANADIASASAAIKAAESAGALSFALAVKKEGELALVAAEARRSASLAELATLGQQQARVTAVQTEATVAHAAAVRALAVAQGTATEVAAANTAAQAGNAAAISGVGVASGIASIAVKGFNAVVAVMGGPIGIAIAALAGLAMWLYNVKSNATQAKEAIEAVNRVNAAKQSGAGGVGNKDIERIGQQLTEAQKKLDETVDRGNNIANNAAAQARYAVTLSKAREQVEYYTKALQDAKDVSLETGGAAGKAARDLNEAKTAWDASISKVKTATTIQDAYKESLKTSQDAYNKYVAKLQENNAGGVNDKEIAAAKARQAEVEIELAKDRDQKLKNLAHKGAADRVKAVRLEADETRSIVQSAMQDRLSVLQTDYDAQKSLLDLRHRNGLIGEGAYLAENLKMVQENEQAQRDIILKAQDDYAQAYVKRQATIKKTLDGQKENDALKKLAADYEKFTTDTNASLKKLDIKSFERLDEVLVRLQGQFVKLKDKSDKYWDKAEARVNKDLAMAKAKEKLAFATEQEQAAYEAVVRVQQDHALQIERQTEAYEAARKEADDFRNAIDWTTAGDDTRAILDALTEQADKFGRELQVAYDRLEGIKQKAAQAAREEVRAKEYNKNITAIGDAITTSIFEGGRQGGKKLREWLVNYFIKNPLTLVINGILGSIMGGAGGILGGFLGGANSEGGATMGGSGGGLGAMANLLSIGKNIIGAIQGGFAGLANNIAVYAQQGINFLTGAGPMAAGQLPGSAAQAIGGAGAVVAGAYGGIMGGRLISNGYSVVGSSGNTAVNVGTAAGAIIGSIIPVIGTALGALLGGLFGGTLNRLFGRKLTEVGIEGTFGGDSGFQGQRYEYYKGGTFRSNKTKYSELDEETRSNFAKTYSTLKDTIVDYSKALGLSTDALKDFAYKFKVNLKDLSPEDAQKALAEEFAKMGIAMADLILGVTTDVGQAADAGRGYLFGVNPNATPADANPNANANTEQIKKFQKAGETSLDTLTRLAISLKTVNAVFENMGRTVLEASLASGDLADKIISAFGTQEDFINKTNAYYEAYYTGAEKEAALRKQVAAGFKELNMEMPGSRDELRKMIDAQDLTTEAGRKNYAALINLSAVFGLLYESADKLAEKEKEIADKRFELQQKILVAEGRQAEATKLSREKELEALKKVDPSLVDLQRRLWELEDAAEAAAEAAQKLKERNDKAFDINQRILQAEGKDREALLLRRQQEYEATLKLDPELAKLLNRLWELEDAATAAADAEKKRQEAEEKRKQIQDKYLDLEQRMLIAQGRDAEALQKRRGVELQALRDLDPALAQMAVQVWALEDAAEAAAQRLQKAKDANNAAFDAVKAAAQREMDAVKAAMEKSNERIGKLREIFQLLASTIDDVLQSVQSVVNMRYATGRQVISNAVANGGTIDRDSLQAAIQGVQGGLTRDNFATKYEMDRARLQFAADLLALKDNAQIELTTEEKTLKTLEDQLKYWQDQISLMQQQMDALRGINTSILSFNEAFALWVRAYEEERAAANKPPTVETPPNAGGNVLPGSNTGGPGAVFGGSSSGWVNTPAPILPRDDYGRVLYPDGSKGPPVDTWFVGVDLHWAELSPYNPKNAGKNLPPLPAFANGGLHDGGLRMVGERGWEIEATGPARYWNQSQLSRALSNDWDNEGDGNDNGDIIDALKAEIGDLKKIVYALGRQQVTTLGSMESIMRKQDKTGLPPVRDPESQPTQN